tara:strand:+ start:3858 stop:4274 length:417 start_codon:yes stop_codon:yes gene_type:complete
MNSFEIIEKVPTPKEYMYLRKAANMAPRDLESAKKGLGNELFSVMLIDKEKKETIGMGRVIGDGGTVFQICDMAVISTYQKKGGGKMIMDALMTFIEEQDIDRAYVNLIADVDNFYEKWGFKPTAPEAKGMYLRTKKL